MPHKRNPITGERLSGLARVIRGNAVAALENVPLWHERDISPLQRRAHHPAGFLHPASITCSSRSTKLVDRLLVYPGEHAAQPRDHQGPLPQPDDPPQAHRARHRAQSRLRSRPARRDEDLAGRQSLSRKTSPPSRRSRPSSPARKSTASARSITISGTSTRRLRS